ncbi:hypothetical protein GOP47_0004353 [Adiantum capillus-veneris]|uniref:Uncharacterized protein n=1 Tax=Adiantum capillus-veneris TaxID=13818 RepID=A0A9D4V835_ADICA|nr:hypothetical protein GOP47_0004353 [Adiantum capillus-veneris]
MEGPDIFRHNGEGRSSTPPPPTFQASPAKNGMASANFAPASATFSNLRAIFISEAQKVGREQAEWGPGNAGDGWMPEFLKALSTSKPIHTYV